jgi:hypothetical protein
MASTSANTAATTSITGTNISPNKISGSAIRRFGDGSKASGAVDAARTAACPTKKIQPVVYSTPEGINAPVEDSGISRITPAESRYAAAVFDVPKSTDNNTTRLP